MRSEVVLTLAFFQSLALIAASLSGTAQTDVSPVVTGRLPDALTSGRDDEGMEEARRKAAGYEAGRFVEQMNEFAIKWNAFANEYRDKGTFNVKKARELGREMRRIEKELPQ